MTSYDVPRDELILPEQQMTSFGTLEIAWDPRVLEPRPWTAAQSRWAAELALDAPDGPVLELCTGAGHIGLLTAAHTDRRLVAVDLDPVACSFATANALRAGLAGRVEVRQGPVDGVLGDHERFGVVVADPPWVPSADVGRFPEDPLLAIDGGDDGLDLARTCIAVAGRHLHAGGHLVLQVGDAAQASALESTAEAAGLRLVEVREFPRGALLRLDR